MTSALHLKEAQKLGRKDELKLNDVEPITYRPDPFKTTYTKQFRKDVVSLKVNNVDHWKSTMSDVAKNTEFKKGYTKC